MVCRLNHLLPVPLLRLPLGTPALTGPKKMGIVEATRENTAQVPAQEVRYHRHRGEHRIRYGSGATAAYLASAALQFTQLPFNMIDITCPCDPSADD